MSAPATSPASVVWDDRTGGDPHPRIRRVRQMGVAVVDALSGDEQFDGWRVRVSLPVGGFYTVRVADRRGVTVATMLIINATTVRLSCPADPGQAVDVKVGDWSLLAAGGSAAFRAYLTDRRAVFGWR